MDPNVFLYVTITLAGLSAALLYLFVLARSGERGKELGKKTLIWLVFLALLYSLRDVFGILFLTFLISFVANTIIVDGLGRLRVSRRPLVIVTYLFFVAVICGTVAFLVPHVRNEGIAFVDFVASLDTTRVDRELDRFLSTRPGLVQSVEALRLREELQELVLSQRAALMDHAQTVLRSILSLLSYFAISLLFSFLIMLDLPAMKAWMVSMRETRLATIYEETSDTVVKFAGVLGQVFQAQILIATANTVLTVIGFLVFDVPSIAFLALVVFLCSFVPVLGVFVSSVPIGLLALRDGGVETLLAMVAWIVVIHAVEAYVLNPRIMAMRMRLNPVLVLGILFVSHHYFGLWGVLFGVPVAFYVFKYALPGHERLVPVAPRPPDPP